MRGVKRPGRRWGFLASILVVFAGVPRARAHPEIVPTLTNRYLTVAVLGDKLEITLSLLLGNLPGGEERRRADTDHDGTLSVAEVDAERGYWLARARDLFRVSIDGRANVIPSLDVSLDLGGAERVVAAPVVVEAIARMTLARARHSIRVGPARDPERLGETEIGAVLAPDWTLVESRMDDRRAGRDLVFKVPGPRSDGSGRAEPGAATFNIEPTAVPATAAPDASQSRGLPWLVTAGAVLALAVALGRRAQARRHRAATPPPVHGIVPP